MSESTHALVSTPLRISGITISHSKKSVKYTELKFGHVTRVLRGDSDTDKILSVPFDPVLEVSVEQISLSIQCWHNLMGVIQQKKQVDVSFTREYILSKANVDSDGKREFRETRDNVTIIFEIRSELASSNFPSSEDIRQGALESSTSEILRACPRFRLLVIGKTGVGKSTLLQRAFKVRGVHVSEHGRGKADINDEHISPENSKFVVHDSMGFDRGGINISIVMNFIADRNNQPHVKDRVHAIWLCVSIPHAKERLLENGIEDFLRSRKDKLGKAVPIIVVFTKLDVYVDFFKLNAMKSGKTLNDAKVEKLKNNELHKLCVRPLQAVAGDDILHVTVSTGDKYENTLRTLVDITTKNIEKYVAAEPALTAAMAQRVDIDLNIKASIDVGKKRHWRGLVAGVNFTGYTMSNCLSVIHDDIVVVWNFQDSGHLSSKEFRELILQGLETKELPEIKEKFEFGLATISAIAAILAPLAGPLIPIVLPIAVSAVAIAWAYQAYKRTNLTLQRIMTYIVDLTCVMQILFLLAPEGPVTRPVIKLALMAYDKGGKGHVHAKIHYSLSSPVARPGQDYAFDAIVELIKNHAMKGDEVEKLRRRIPHIQLQADDEW